MKKIAKKRERSENIAYVWLILPVVAVGIFCVYPAIAAIARSFMNWTPSKSEWIGFGNFKELFSDEMLGKSFGNMTILVLLSLLTGNIMTLLLAELLFKMRFKRTEKVFRYLFLLPALVPGMVTVLLWRNVILSGASEGLMNHVLALFGKPASAWYYDRKTVILSMIITNFPWVGGVSFLIYLAGLQAIPESMYEASDLEGANSFQKVIYIDLPYLVGQIKYFLIIGIISGVQVYDLQLILGFSALDTASNVPGYLLYYYTFANTRYGYAASIGTTLFLITLIFTAISNIISDKIRKENDI